MAVIQSQCPQITRSRKFISSEHVLLVWTATYRVSHVKDGKFNRALIEIKISPFPG